MQSVFHSSCAAVSIKKLDSTMKAEASWNTEYLFIAIAPRSTLAWSGSTSKDPIYGLNRTIQCTSAKLSCLKLNCFNIWTVYLCWTESFEMELGFFYIETVYLC